jgi:aryl-alcohol dehydrogenase-like predicted oxidoreductase
MQRRQIGSLSVSVVGVGCNNFNRQSDEQQSIEVVNTALDLGINFFDTADAYSKGGSELALGKALQTRRGEALIATKFGQGVGAKAETIRTSVEDSLRRLGTDVIDLFQLHWPDPNTPISETLEALGELVDQGKVREIGCSNFNAKQLQEAHEAIEATRPHFASVQNPYNLLDRQAEADVLPLCNEIGMAFLPYYPVANGLLTGKYRRGETPPIGTRLGEAPDERRDSILTEDNFNAVESLSAFAESRGHTILDLAFSWLISRPAIASVIAGARSPDQVRANSEAASWILTEEELAEVDRLTLT